MLPIKYGTLSIFVKKKKKSDLYCEAYSYNSYLSQQIVLNARVYVDMHRAVKKI